MKTIKIATIFMAAAFLAGAASAESIIEEDPRADVGGGGAVLSNTYTWTIDVDKLEEGKNTLDELPSDMVAYLIDISKTDASTTTGYKQFASVAAADLAEKDIGGGKSLKFDGLYYLHIRTEFESSVELGTYWETPSEKNLRTVIVSSAVKKALIIPTTFAGNYSTLGGTGYFDNIIDVPEPTSGALALLGLAFVALKRKHVA